MYLPSPNSIRKAYIYHVQFKRKRTLPVINKTEKWPYLQSYIIGVSAQMHSLCSKTQRIHTAESLSHKVLNCKQCTFTGISSSWFAVSAVKTYDISLWDVVCLQMAHLIELRRVPTLYCSMMIATHSLQKQCPHVSTAHYAGNKKNQHKQNCGSDLDHWKRKLVY